MTPFRVLRLFAAASALVLTPVHAQAQNGADHAAWLTFGFGGTGNGDYHGPAGCISGSYLSEAGLFSARLLSAGEAQAGPASPAGTVNDLLEVSGTYGLVYQGPQLLLSASAGVALLWIEQQAAPGVDRSTTVGLPVILSASFVPVRFLGIGASVFATVNATASYSGIVGCISIGNMK